MKKTILTFALPVLLSVSASADAPAGYYRSAEGKTGEALLSALSGIMGSHTNVGYDGLWEVYKTSDVTEDGRGLWDMYSTKVWSLTSERCGNYSKVGDCVNREHSFPKSWFDNKSPMSSDAFHIYPTDGKVNGQRSNFPYGECASGTTLASNNGVDALGKLGTSTFTGYSGKVFEPADMYKGDFARSYFYMAAAYYGKVSGWSSDMLGGTDYPAFKSWAQNLLLKWHRNDAVSSKETRRNDAVYARQKNRNPFIDHPELVEYIWGNKVGTPWYPGGEIDPIIVSPADGSAIDLGYAATGIVKSADITLRGTNIKDAVSVSVTSPFKVSATTVTAAEANAGKNLTLSFVSSTTGSFSGTLTIKSGGAVMSRITVTANVVSGLVAESASAVTEGSFVARWVNVSGAGAAYNLYVERDGEILQGYPVSVDAAAEFRRVGGLEPETTYVYYIAEGERVSNRISVTTAAAVPSIQLYYDDALTLYGTAGIPTEPVELLFDTENIAGEINTYVSAPFQVSSDKTTWSEVITLYPGEDRFYLRLNGNKEGTFSTVIKMIAGSYIYDDVEFEGVVTEKKGGLTEDFETENCKDNYTNGDYAGNAGTWYCDNVGVYRADADKAINGTMSARYGKNGSSCLTLKDIKTDGLGTISFKGKKWSSSEADAAVEAEYSTDGGTTWTSAGTANIGTDAKEYSYEVNVRKPVNIRLRQISGARLFIDDITMTSPGSGVSQAKVDYHQWDAYSADGRLVIENSVQSRSFCVYSVDGVEVLTLTLGTGSRSCTLAPGLYIVVCDDFARKVLVK